MGFLKLMLDYILGICQYKILSCVVVTSILLAPACTLRYKRKFEDVEPIPVWQKTEEKFSHRNEDNDFERHVFFDLLPYTDLNENQINFVPLTPVQGQYGYNLDILSGKKFKRFQYCEQNDIWDNYGSTISYPPYTAGIVPRLLDQLGRPQKIVVFGNDSYYKALPLNYNNSRRVKVIGGMVEQYCQNFPCSKNDDWASRLVLFAVDLDEKKFEKVDSLRKLWRKVDKDYVKAFMQNGEGRTVRYRLTSSKDKFYEVQKELPVIRMVGEIDGSAALRFALTKGHFFKFDELKYLRASCHKFYDYVWDAAQKTRLPEDEELIRQYASFTTLWNTIRFKYAKQLKMCIKFVRPSNINKNVDRHWFFAYIASVLYLEELGYVYSCSHKHWFKNPRLVGKKYRFDPIKIMRGCTTADLDNAMVGAIEKMKSLKRMNHRHYRYIAYDEGIGGSHKKIYSWVHFSGKRMSCESHQRRISVMQKDHSDHLVFPLDVKWKAFYSSKFADELGIIE
ncbi:MAG: hypothetical protein ISR65_02220 [Bacteriovoracaceae bacterium]|nr:hypothetical protein [Bacteriovoracaceae bacterium]